VTQLGKDQEALKLVEKTEELDIQMLTSQSNLHMLRRARVDLDYLRTISSKTSRDHKRLPIKMSMMEAAARKTR